MLIARHRFEGVGWAQYADSAATKTRRHALLPCKYAGDYCRAFVPRMTKALHTARSLGRLALDAPSNRTMPPTRRCCILLLLAYRRVQRNTQSTPQPPRTPLPVCNHNKNRVQHVSTSAREKLIITLPGLPIHQISDRKTSATLQYDATSPISPPPLNPHIKIKKI